MSIRFRKFWRDTDGATAIEYAMIASILCLAIVVGLTGIGSKLSSYFSEISSSLK